MAYEAKQAALENEGAKKGGFSGDNQWLKMEAGSYTLRIGPPWSDAGLPTRKLVNHHGFTIDGKQRAPMCYRFIFENEDIAKILVKINALSVEDWKAFKKYGCPGCILPQRIADQQGQDAARELWPRTQFLWNVVNRKDGKLYSWSTSTKIYEVIRTNFKMDNDLFHPEKGRDLMIEATGSGMARRYGAPVFSPKSSPLGLDPYKPFNLDTAMAKGVITFAEFVAAVVANKTNFNIDDRLGDIPHVGNSAPVDKPFEATDDDIPF
jgi:hypothetical protein